MLSCHATPEVFQPASIKMPAALDSNNNDENRCMRVMHEMMTAALGSWAVMTHPPPYYRVPSTAEMVVLPAGKHSSEFTE
jgi:hypothetical protein